MGAELAANAPDTFTPFYAHFPGAEAVASESGYFTVGGTYARTGGNWYFLEDQIAKRPNIKRMYQLQRED